MYYQLDSLDAFCGAMNNLLNGEIDASLDKESISMVLEQELTLLIDFMSRRYMYESKIRSYFALVISGLLRHASSSSFTISQSMYSLQVIWIF